MFGILKKCGTKKYVWRLGIIQEPLWILLISLCDFSDQNVWIPPYDILLLGMSVFSSKEKKLALIIR